MTSSRSSSATAARSASLRCRPCSWAIPGRLRNRVEIIRLLRLAEDVPPLLVVGVGYPVATLEDNFELRCRDFTPSVDLASGYTDAAMMGGAGRFLAFLREELKPWAQQR